MTYPAVLAPLFAQVLLVFVVAFVMAARRRAALSSRAVRRDEVSIGERAWPPAAQAASNAYANQFELPVLFYVAVIVALLTRKADLVFVVLSWIFVGTRVAHAAAYLGGNVVPRRFAAFIVGAIVLMVMWAVLAFRVLLAP